MEPQLPWSTRADGIEIKIRVTPRGGRDAIEGVEALSDGRPVLKVRVRAAPEDGAANEGIRRLLAKAVRRPPSAVALTAGATARVKTFAIEGDPTALAEALATAARTSA
jgi:uncharacterized protein YggU (UPF0235/DUF167 family)